MAALPAELARLDRAVAESRREPGVEDEPPSPLVDLADLMVRPETRLRTPASLRLLATTFDLLPVVGAAGPPGVPPRVPSWCAVTRTDHRVRVLAVTRCQHAFLEHCGTEGAEFVAAAHHAAAAAELPPAEAWVELAAWLPGAIVTGMVMVDPDAG